MKHLGPAKQEGSANVICDDCETNDNFNQDGSQKHPPRTGSRNGSQM